MDLGGSLASDMADFPLKIDPNRLTPADVHLQSELKKLGKWGERRVFEWLLKKETGEAKTRYWQGLGGEGASVLMVSMSWSVFGLFVYVWN